MEIKKDKLYLVTGGSGFLGERLVQRILSKGGRVRVFARNEGKLIELRQKFPTIEVLTGNLSDRFDLRQALDKVDAVFHLAAFKHVGMAELQARECINSNVVGSLILLEETAGMELDFVIGISTDKVAQVAGVYGATKLLMERLFSQFEKNYPGTEYRIVRYGNVLYSTGSVLFKWKHLITSGEPVIVTDPNATRFYWTANQAVDLIFDCLKNATNSKPYVPKMKAMSIKDLLAAMIEVYGTGQVVPINEIGLQPGENLHEKILENGLSSNEAEQYTIDEIKDLI